MPVQRIHLIRWQLQVIFPGDIDDRLRANTALQVNMDLGFGESLVA